MLITRNPSPVRAAIAALALLFAPLALVAGAAAPGPAHAGEPFRNLSPVAPPPADAALQAGLAVTYYYAKIRDVDEIAGWVKHGSGKAGPPLPQLNYAVGTGAVLTSSNSDGVIAVIDGLIKLDPVGDYSFLVNSNDGVEVTLGGTEIHSDPGVHADRLSDEIVVEITEPGWYPLQILYFERKNTSTLELYWMPPGLDDFDFVPAAAFAHQPKS